MQTANGIVELANEITFDIEKLQQSTTAVIGKDTPGLLSVGYRCQELGYGFYWPPHSIPYLVLPDGKTEVDLEVDQFVPYLLDTGDTAIHKPSSSSRCYPVTLVQKDSDNTIFWRPHIDEKCGIVDPSQCPNNRDCEPLTMMNFGPADDPHRAIGSDTLAAKCVEHISVADSALPDAAISTVASSENVVSRGKDASGASNVDDGFSIKNECVSEENTPSGECHVPFVTEESSVVKPTVPITYAMFDCGGSEPSNTDFMSQHTWMIPILTDHFRCIVCDPTTVDIWCPPPPRCSMCTSDVFTCAPLVEDTDNE